MNTSPTHLLSYGKGVEPVYFFRENRSLQGKAFPSKQNLDTDILLAGGFPTTHSEAPFPLSPTLQLNGDFGRFSEQELAAIGKAELIRNNSQRFRSYVREPDSRIAVLGNDAKALHAFVDRYGGILQIDPLLIQEYDSEFTTAQTVELVRDNEQYKLSFAVKEPVVLERCTYCGVCGPVCPEQCLSEQLFLDFSRCTGCKDCVLACPEKAIDLHIVEQREIMTPAVLLLEGTSIDLPSQRSHIYSENELDRFFDSIYIAQIEEVLTWTENICQYSSKLGIGCKKCLLACHYSAVSLDRDGVHIDHQQCMECGSCLADCPTGALQYARFDDRHFIEYFRTVAIKPNTTVVLGNEQELHRYWWLTEKFKTERILFLEYPQPEALSSMHLFLLFAMGAGKIFLLTENCRETTPISHQIKLANTVLNSLLNGKDVIRWGNQYTLHEELRTTPTENPLPEFYHNFSFTTRREKLADLLSFLLAHSTADPILLTGTAASSFGEIVCEPTKCTLCNACVAQCRIGALTADGNRFTLNHQPSLCVQCTACIELCPEKALRAQPGLSLHPDFFKQHQLAQAEPARCLGCGKIFGTRQTLNKVLAVLAEKQLWEGEDNLLQYCDTCRVVQLLATADK